MKLDVVQAPDGVRGLDTNSVVNAVQAKAIHAAGYRFVIRYVRRAPKHDYDISALEIATLAHAGLAVGIVQHVAPENWTPTEALGREYGQTAAHESQRAGVPHGVTVWCDLEGVKRGTPAEDVIGYLNRWWDAVAHEGYLPGLYVGWQPGITADQLYRRLKFQAYWAAYNLNKDQYPAVRGVCMQQAREQQISGLRVDPDVAMQDKLNNRATFLAPELWPEV